MGVIPARLRSTRLPQKMLADICGWPLIYYTWRQAKKAKFLDEVVVATDAKKIYDAVKKFGGLAIMTSAKHKSGSDRIAEAAKKFSKFKPEIIVNIQGDEPLISPIIIDMATRELLKNQNEVIATVAVPFRKKSDIEDRGCVKVVLDKNNHALYFSRSKIPYNRNPYAKYLKHLGIYAFRRNFLFRYVKFHQSSLELAEGLEQLRVLENGFKIKVAVCNAESTAVDTIEDLRRVGAIIQKQK